jgi:hypothetical protein
VRYVNDKYVEKPNGNSIVWRYMQHWKLEKLLNDSALFFPNAANLSDEYEVSIPDDTRKLKRRQFEKEGFQNGELNEKLEKFFWESNPMKDHVLLNCWSICPHESYALWKIYLRGENNGIAIKSTVSALSKSVQEGGDKYAEDFYVGKVRYKLKLNENELNRLMVITTKKPYYDFEKELRLFIVHLPMEQGGIVPPYDISVGRSVNVNLQLMVHKIFVSPFADAGYKERLSGLLKTTQLKTDVLRDSEIRDK